MIEYETLTDVCPVCGAHGYAPCVDTDTGADAPDHEGRKATIGLDK
jgi:hypothetical protein